MSDTLPLESRVLESGSDRAEAGDAWRALAERRGNAFITPEWSQAWADAYGDSAASVTVAVWGPGEDLAGVVPLVVKGGVMPKLGFAGANTADLLEPACEPGMEAAVLDRALDVVSGRNWSLLVLDNVPCDATWPEEVAATRRLRAISYRDAAMPYIDLHGVSEWDGYLATRSRNMRSQVRRRERALSRDHELVFRRTTNEATLADDLATFFRLHYARWDERGGSTSRGEAARAFHGSFAAAALARGWLRLWFCELDGEPVASWYGWHVGDTYSYYLAGFDPSWADRGVGGVLLAHTIRSAIEDGAKRYDLLLGDESYKGRYATGARSVRTVLLARRRPAHALAQAEARLWRLSRRLPPDRRDALRARAGRLLALLPGSRTR